MTGVEILDCTLRDGSYEVEFQFTAEDTALLCYALESVGIRLIEIGHGLGLGATRAGKNPAAATDVEYMQAAASSLSKASWGMFFIPGIGTLDDLSLAAQHGMDFVRIGTNAHQVEQSRAHVEAAKGLGMTVCANLMKSYSLAPQQLLAEARRAEEYGVDMVALVDSAGCMLPEQVREYVTCLRDGLSVPIGFHGHDNLSLGIANVLAAVEAGCTRVDTTLQGIGRGAGNAITELVIATLGRKGIDLGVDLNALMSISERLVRPLLRSKGWDSLDITSGIAGFHSSHLQTVTRSAEEHRVDPHELIVELCKIDQVHAPAALVAEVARSLAARGEANVDHEASPIDHVLPRASPLPDTLFERVRSLANEAHARARKQGTPAVLNLVCPQRALAQAQPSAFIQEGFGFVFCSVEASALEQVEQIVRAADGVVDLFFVDAEHKAHLDAPLLPCARRTAERSEVFGYRDNEVWLRAVERLLQELLGDTPGEPIVIAGVDRLARGLALRLADRGARVTLTGAPAASLQAALESLVGLTLCPSELSIEPDAARALSEARALVGFERDPPVIRSELVAAMPKDGVVIDAGIGAVAPEAYAVGPEIVFCRPDMRAELASELSAVLGAHRLATEAMGASTVAGIPVVGGGRIGASGDVVLDSVGRPSRVVGLADGSGRVVGEDGEHVSERLDRVRRELLRRQLTRETERQG